MTTTELGAISTQELDSSDAQPRRRRGAAATAPRRARRAKVAGDDLLSDLAQRVDQLIKENRELKRTLERVAKNAQASAGMGQATKVLSGLQRRVAQALESRPAGRGRGLGRGAAAATAPASRPRRKVTDPVILERRREALAKARAALKAKREAGG
jgi:cell division septum initiation protein DivIVA